MRQAAMNLAWWLREDMAAMGYSVDSVEGLQVALGAWLTTVRPAGWSPRDDAIADAIVNLVE